MIHFGARRGAKNEGGSEPELPPWSVDHPTFRRWFDGSVVTERDGSPRIVYHQTPMDNAEAIRRQGFDVKRVGQRKGDEQMPDGVFVKFTSKVIFPRVSCTEQMGLYAAVRRPLKVRDREELEAWSMQDGAYREARRRLDARNLAGHLEWERSWDSLKGLVRGVDDAEQVRIHRQSTLAMDRWTNEVNEIAAEMRGHVTGMLREQGYDALWVTEDRGSGGRTVETLVVLDPAQLRETRAPRRALGSGSPAATGSRLRVYGAPATGSRAREARGSATQPDLRARLTAALPSLRRLFGPAHVEPSIAQIAAWGADHGWPYLGKGESRVVFRLSPTRVVKFAIPESFGVDHNQLEAKVWALADARLRLHLVPVRGLGAGGRWLRMDYVHTPGRISDPRVRTLLTRTYGIEDVPFAGEIDPNVSADGRLLDYAQVDLDQVRRGAGLSSKARLR